MTMTAEPMTGTKLRAIVNTGDFRAAIQAAQMLTKGRTPKPVLACVKITTTDAGLTIEATDLERTLRQCINTVQVESAGAVLVNADAINDVFRYAADDTVSIEDDGNRLTIRTQSRKVVLPTMLVKDYPPVPSEMEGERFTIEGASLTALIASTKWAVDDRPGRYSMNGMMMEVGPDRLRAVATEGHVLCLSDATATSTKKVSALIDGSTIEMIGKLFADSGSVEFGISEHRVIVESGGVTFGCNLLEGAFPAYEDIVPSRESADTVIRIARETLLDAVRQAAPFADEQKPGLRFEFSKSGVRIYCRSDKGESDVLIPCKVDGKDITIGISAPFLLLALAAAPAEEVEMCMQTPSRPVLLIAGQNWRGCVSPMNLQ